MTVKELITKLQEMDQDRIVVASSDSEGNSFRKISDICTGNYRDREFGIDVLTNEDIEQGYTEEDCIEGESAVCLW
jgi:hypothetical protein